MTNKQQIEGMNDRNLVTFWNISQAGRHFGNIHPVEDLISDELTRREIPHEVGKRTLHILPVLNQN